MSNIDKQALREIAAAAVGAHERLSVMPPDDIFDISLAEGTQLDADITALNALNSAANPATVLALLDELEAKDKAWSAQDNHINQQADRIESLEKKNGELGRALGAAEKRIAELEARTVTLPQYRNSPDMHTKQFYEAIGFNQGLDIFIEALRDAGIGVKGE